VHRSRQKFAPDRQRPVTSRRQPIMSCQRPATNCQRPIMSRERLIMTPNYTPKPGHNNSYVSRSTALYKPSVVSSTDMQQLASVRLTDKKCAGGYSQHCDCSTKTSTSGARRDASRKVPFPRSNSKRIFCAQFPTGEKELNFSQRKNSG